MLARASIADLRRIDADKRGKERFESAGRSLPAGRQAPLQKINGLVYFLERGHTRGENNGVSGSGEVVKRNEIQNVARADLPQWNADFGELFRRAPRHGR